MIHEIKDNGQRVFIAGNKKEREEYYEPLKWWNKLPEEQRKEHQKGIKTFDLENIINIYNNKPA